MKNTFKMLVFLLIAALLLNGCWKQRDVITIKKDGKTTFRADVIITEKDFSFQDIEELSAEFMGFLKKSGWKIEKKWVSKSKPLQLKFWGEGNLRSVSSATDFYKIHRRDENSITISFVPAESKGGRSSRSIKFDQPLFGGAKILDEHGKEVKEIENVIGNKVYKIIF